MLRLHAKREVATEAVGPCAERCEQNRCDGLGLRDPAHLEIGEVVHGKALQREGRVDAEIAPAATAAGPEEVRVLARIDGKHLARRAHHFAGDELVGGDARRAHGEADAAAEEEAAAPTLGQRPWVMAAPARLSAA